MASFGPGGIFYGAGNFLPTGKKDSPDGAQKEELCNPLTKKGKKVTPTFPRSLHHLQINTTISSVH
jgi:hypothetical protein